MTENLDRHQQVRALFERMGELPPSGRAAALAEACEGNPALRTDVDRLLAADAQAGSFLEHGASPGIASSDHLIGRRVGQYEIETAIGAGGMGEVYRAHDTTLHRDVALKVLPEAFASDPDRLMRFKREAHILASLNHPNIAAIYGFEECDGIRALVLEMVDGPTLADRIGDGPIPLDEALQIARQIVDAFDAAHGHGVIHRDLKPANVKLRPDGTVKVLDFGLAKAVQPRAVDSARSPSSRLSPAMTHPGMMVGTAAYMSPEQAKGHAADKRSDIWAFGCVLFEMLTGRPPFEAETLADTLAMVRTKDPNWTLLPPTLPSPITRLMRRCLEKDRQRRIADIADTRLDLDEPVDEPDTPVTATAARQPLNARTRLRGWLPSGVAGVSIGVALSLVAFAVLNRSTRELAVSRSSVLLPARLGATANNRGATVALAPDGRRLAFVGADATGRTQLWVRTLDDVTARPLAGTEGAQTPFWSPDSQWLAFVANGTLKKVGASGGPVGILCESAWAGGSWSRDDVIVFTTTSHALARVSAMGGTPTAVTTLDLTASEWGHVSPSLLPDGRHVVHAAIQGSGQPLGVYVASIDSGERTRLPIDANFVQYVDGFLWFERGRTLMAQPFDAETRRIIGHAVPIAEQLRTKRNTVFFSASAAGALVFQSDALPGYDLTWFDRGGRRIGTLGTRDDYADLSLSPDGRRVLVSVGESEGSNRDLWIFDVARGVRTRLTSDPTPEMHNAWSPDGTRIVFDVRSPGHFGLFQKLSNGMGGTEVVLANGADINPFAWSPDGRFIMYVARTGGTSNLWVLPLEGDRKPFPFTRTQFNVGAQFSPDGRWVAYFSNDSGRMEIYVAPFPGPGAKVLVSTGGGSDARWRRDGREIVYLDVSTTTLMSAAVTTDHERFDVIGVKPLFALAKIGPRFSYDISADGQRILAVTQNDDVASAPLTLVLNWPAILRR